MKTLQIRLPDELRDQADSVLAAMGLDLPTAVRLYLTKAVQTRSMPFALEATGARVETIDVDAETQDRTDEVAAVRKKRRAGGRSPA